MRTGAYKAPQRIKPRENRVVKPIKPPPDPEDNKPVKGAELIPDLYRNIFCCAPTKSGKTTVIGHLLKHTTDPRTEVTIICSTANLDKTWMLIVEGLKKRKIPLAVHDDIIDDQGVNVLEEYLQEIEEEAKLEQLKKEVLEQELKLKKLGLVPAVSRKMPPMIKLEYEPAIPSMNPEHVLMEAKEEKKEKRKKQYKDRVPERLIILDDLPKSVLRSSAIVNLCKRARHLKIRMILSSQAIIHIEPDCWSQVSDLFLWGGFSRDYIYTVWDRVPNSLTKKEFFDLYQKMTAEKHSFWNLNIRDNTYRQNFSRIERPLNEKDNSSE